MNAVQDLHKYEEKKYFFNDSNKCRMLNGSRMQT